MKYWTFLLGLLMIFTGGRAQKLATLTVELDRLALDMSIPVSINLDDVTFAPDSVLVLMEVWKNKRTTVPFQVVHGTHRSLVWFVTTGDRPSGKRSFELVYGRPPQYERLSATSHDGALTIRRGEKNLLRYHYGMVYPPPGVDTVFRRSAFIHPLWSPRGQILTRIQAPDHYHHYGIWNSWTQVLYKGDTVDFWNLYKRQGTVRFAGFISLVEGPVFAEYDALHEHVVFKKNRPEEVAMVESQKVRIYYPNPERNCFIVDVTMTMNCAGNDPFLILEYRYAGLGWRATEQWNRDNSEVITSTGKSRKEADGSKERWCIVQGDLEGGMAGVVMMSYPANYNHPEPMRIWPENMNNTGDLFASFTPVKDRDWLLKPGEPAVLRYRFLVFNGRYTAEQADAAWHYFTRPPAVTIKRTQ